MPAISPFPFAAGLLVPVSPREAGEDEEEVKAEKVALERVEGDLAERDAEEDEAQGDTDRLLSPPNRRSRGETSIFAKSNTGGPRWCKKCEGWKPDRCHHCRYCRTCVLKSQ